MTVDHPSVQRATELLSEAQTEGIRDVLRNWLEIHPKLCLPGRQHFERAPYRFKVRVLGTIIADAFGKDFTGKYMDEVFAGHDASLSHSLRVQVVESGLPCLRPAVPGTFQGLDIAPLEGVHLPLAADGRNIDFVLSMFVYLPRSSNGDDNVWFLVNR
jgi:hypothetical protein